MAIQLWQSLLAIGCIFGMLVDPLAAASPDHSSGEQAADAADAGNGANARTPVPSVEKLTEALKDVQEVYSGELAAAKSADAKKALAKKLLKTAGETDKAKDASARYTLLRMARDYAAQVGDVETAFGAVDEIVGSFEVDPLETRSAAVVKLAATVRAKDQHKALAAKGLSLIHAALVADNFPVARQIASLARAEAQKGADKALLDEIAELAAEIDSIAKGYDAAKTALATLKENASDPMANLAVGKYEALDKADWTSGLPKLAASSDAALKEAAAKDLAGAETTDARVALGDQWWELAEKQEGIAKRRIRARAASWYKLALPELSGLEKQKITRRVTQVSVELTKLGESIDKPGAGAVHKANRTELVGGPGGKPFEDQPAKRSLLAGFDITLGAWVEKPVPFIWSLEPVYVGDQGNFTTKIYGHQAREKIHAVVAKPGYAVAGMTVNSENIVNGFKLKFMRIRGTALDPTDSYDSDWIGGQWGKQQAILGGDGKPVIGCFGHAGDGVDGIGLILSE